MVFPGYIKYFNPNVFKPMHLLWRSYILRLSQS